MKVADSLTVDTNLTYCPVTLNVSQPLNITNVSQHELVFKIKTNKKNFISMNPCNGFLKPFNTMSIPVKIVEKVPENVSIKLEVDWALVTPQMKQKNDIKMLTVNEKDVCKKVFPIVRKQEVGEKVSHEPLYPTLPKSTKNPLPEIKKLQQSQKKISPFQYEKKQPQAQLIESQKKHLQSPQKIEQIPKRVQLPIIQIKQRQKMEVQVADEVSQYQIANNMLSSIILPTKGLEIVSEQDEEDHQKELEQIKNQQIEELRRIDQIKSKARKLNMEIKSTEIIDSKLLTFALIGSYLVGSLVQYLVF